MGKASKKEDVKTPDPEMLKNFGLLQNLEIMEMLVDTGVDKKMKPAPGAPEGKKK